MRARCLLIAFWMGGLLCGGVSAVEFEDMLERAAEQDLRVRKALLSLERQKIVFDKQAAQGLSLSLSSGGPRYTLDASGLFDSPPSVTHNADMAVSMSLGIGDPLNSSLSLSVSTSTDFQDIPSLSASLSYTQPLNALLGWRPKTVQELQEQVTLDRAVIGIYLQKVAVKKEVVAQLKNVASLQLRLLEIEETTQNINESVEQAKMLGTYKKGSYQATSWDHSLQNLKEEQEQYQTELDHAMTTLSRTGSDPNALPPVPEADLQVPTLGEQDKNTQVYLLKQDIAVAEAKRKEIDFSAYPDLSVSASLNVTSLSLTPSFSFSWKLFDNGVLRHTKAEQDKAVEILKLDLDQARASFGTSVSAMTFSIAGIERRRNSLAREQTLLELEIKQNSDQLAKGIVTSAQHTRQSRKLAYKQARLVLRQNTLKLDTYSLYLDGLRLITPVVPIIH